jgi:hypothetical protein
MLGAPHPLPYSDINDVGGFFLDKVKLGWGQFAAGRSTSIEDEVVSGA